MDAQRLGDDVAYPHARVERRVRVLEDDLHVAPQALHLGAPRHHHVQAVEHDSSGGRLGEPQDHASGGRLAAAALPYQTEGLALFDGERDVVDGVHLAGRTTHNAAADREVLLEVANLEQAHAAVSLKRGSEERMTVRSSGGIQQWTPWPIPTISSSGQLSLHSGRS